MTESERVFNTFRRKIYRPFYSIREFRAGMVILLLLLGVTAWVVWRGNHPDPELFHTQENLLTAKGAKVPVYKRPLQRMDQPAGAGAASGPAQSSALEPFPAGLASDSWKTAGPVQMFDETTLSDKIDGRESFYKSFGFQKLYFLSLQSTAGNLTIDIELFDLGSLENALGAMSAEISNPDSEVKMDENSLWYFTANGGFFARGKYYARMLGSDDNADIRTKITQMKDQMAAQWSGEKLPWTYALFIGSVGASPGAIKYQKENAFSFGFASDVYSAVVPGSKETEVFVLKSAGERDAEALAAKFVEGFGSYGTKVKGASGKATLVHNDFINTIEGVEPFGSYVIGIRFAKDPQEAQRWMGKLKAALQKMGSA